MQCVCSRCGISREVSNGEYNRAKRRNAPLYCGRICAGIARRKLPIPEFVRKAAKADYDRLRRELLADEIKRKKADYYQKTKDPAKEAIKRKERMPKHVEYCRRPEYKAWKSRYDTRHRAKKQFGEYAEAALTLREIENEIDERATRYEIYMTNGTINKALKRRRELCKPAPHL